MSLPIKTKQERVAELGKLISLNMEGRMFPRQTRSAVQEQQDRLEFRLKKLREDFTEEEADLKIEAMEAVLKIIQDK